MGRSTNSAIFPFALPYVYEGDYRDDDPLIRAHRDLEDIDEEGDYSEYTEPLEGWKRESEWLEAAGVKTKGGRIYTEAYSKGPHKVGILNESEYASVGCVSITILAMDRESLEEFRRDWHEHFESETEIEENYIAQQTF